MAETPSYSMETFQQAIIKFVQTNYMTIFLVIYVFVKVYNGRKPIAEIEGSLVRGIKDGFHWDKVFEEAKAENCNVICDFYADWCGPCKRVAPILSQLSINCKNDKVIFIKVNVDTCKDLAVRNEIKAMPTFIFYNSNGDKVNTIQGWQGDIKPFDDFAKLNGKKTLSEAKPTVERTNETDKSK